MNVAETVRGLQRIAPPGKTTARTVVLLAKYLDRTAREAKQALVREYAEDRGVIVDLGPLEIEAGFGLVRSFVAAEHRAQVERIARDLTDARLRSVQYRAAVADLAPKSTDLPPIVRPLFRVVPSSAQDPGLVGAPFNTPDVVAPILALNQYDAFRQDIQNFDRDLWALIQAQGRKVGGALPRIVVGGGLTAAVLVAAIAVGRRRT